MNSRQLLIIHESRVIRNLLKGFILSELDDVTPFEAALGTEAEEIIEKNKIDIVLCADYLKDIDGAALKAKIQSGQEGAEIPFVIFTSTDKSEHIAELKAQGVTHYLVTPFTSVDLRKMIDHVFDPRNMRRQNRYNIPGTQVIVHLENQNITAEVINLSLGSVFCEFSLPTGHWELLNSNYISLRFPKEFAEVLIDNIYCKLLSLKTISWLNNNAPDKIRVVWLFKQLSQRNEARFAAVLDQAEEINKNLVNLEKGERSELSSDLL